MLVHRASSTLIASSFVLVCTSLLLNACGPKPKQSLSLMLRPGGTYQFIMRETAEVEMTGGEKSFSADSSMELGLLLRPQDVQADGNSLVTVDIQRAHIPSFMGQLERAFTSYSFDMHISPAGRITALSGTDAFRVRAFAVAQANPAAPSDIKQSDTDVVASDDAIRSWLEPILSVWPNVPVSAGDTWTRSAIYHPQWDCNEESTFTLTSIEGGIATIEITSQFSPAGKIQGRAFSGSGTGEVRISPAEGTIRAYSSTIDMKGALTNKTSGRTLESTGTYRIQGELTAR